MDLFWFMASEGSVCHSRMVLAEQNSVHSDIQGAGRENASVYQVLFPSLYPPLPPAYKTVLRCTECLPLIKCLLEFLHRNTKRCALVSEVLLSPVRWTIKTFLC